MEQEYVLKEYVVKAITGYRVTDAKQEWQVQWDGYEGLADEFTWEPAQNFNKGAMWKEYEQKRKQEELEQKRKQEEFEQQSRSINPIPISFMKTQSKTPISSIRAPKKHKIKLKLKLNLPSLSDHADDSSDSDPIIIKPIKKSIRKSIKKPIRKSIKKPVIKCINNKYNKNKNKKKKDFPLNKITKKIPLKERIQKYLIPKIKLKPITTTPRPITPRKRQHIQHNNDAIQPRKKRKINNEEINTNKKCNNDVLNDKDMNNMDVDNGKECNNDFLSDLAHINDDKDQTGLFPKHMIINNDNGNNGHTAHDIIVVDVVDKNVNVNSNNYAPGTPGTPSSDDSDEESEVEEINSNNKCVVNVNNVRDGMDKEIIKKGVIVNSGNDKKVVSNNSGLIAKKVKEMSAKCNMVCDGTPDTPDSDSDSDSDSDNDNVNDNITNTNVNTNVNTNDTNENSTENNNQYNSCLMDDYNQVETQTSMDNNNSNNTYDSNYNNNSNNTYGNNNYSSNYNDNNNSNYNGNNNSNYNTNSNSNYNNNDNTYGSGNYNNNYNNNGRGNYYNKYNNDYQNKKVCYTCGKPGHFARECTQQRNYNNYKHNTLNNYNTDSGIDCTVTIQMIPESINKHTLLRALAQQYHTTVIYCDDPIPHINCEPFYICKRVQLDKIQERDLLIQRSHAGRFKINGKMLSVVPYGQANSSNNNNINLTDNESPHSPRSTHSYSSHSSSYYDIKKRNKHKKQYNKPHKVHDIVDLTISPNIKHKIKCKSTKKKSRGTNIYSKIKRIDPRNKKIKIIYKNDNLTMNTKIVCTNDNKYKYKVLGCDTNINMNAKQMTEPETEDMEISESESSEPSNGNIVNNNNNKGWIFNLCVEETSNTTYAKSGDIIPMIKVCISELKLQSMYQFHKMIWYQKHGTKTKELCKYIKDIDYKCGDIKHKEKVDIKWILNVTDRNVESFWDELRNHTAVFMNPNMFDGNLIIGLRVEAVSESIATNDKIIKGEIIKVSIPKC